MSPDTSKISATAAKTAADIVGIGVSVDLVLQMVSEGNSEKILARFCDW